MKFKCLAKLSALLILVFIFPLMAFASGKMEVNIGEKVTLNAEGIPGVNYKWVVKKEKDIVNTQTTPIFNYAFSQQGEYEVKLSILKGTTEVIKSTTIWVLAGDHYVRGHGEEGEEAEKFLKLSLSMLPEKKADGSVHLLGGGKVFFNLDGSIGEILEYRIDRNIFEDSDGNGVANDDIDNRDDDSYLIGGTWQTAYREGESAKIVAEVILVDKYGQKTKKQVKIVFDEVPERVGAPLAVLDTTPPPDPKDDKIHLYEDKAKVGFYARRSNGKIVEYRIDQNIFFDSNGDGNPANDIDNLNDISFKTGDVWEAEYEKTDQQIIAQLIVVGEDGKGSRIQKGIVFSKRPAPGIAELAGGIRLVSDKDFVLKGDPISFNIRGISDTTGYTFHWDFDGDGEVDKEIEEEGSVQHIFEIPGVFDVSVSVADSEGNTLDYTLTTYVKETLNTIANFDVEIDGTTVRFANKSIAAQYLSNKKLDYVWSFGDTDDEGYERQKDQIGATNPVYTYKYQGNYIATLTVTDADRVTDSRATEIGIEEGLVFTEETETGEPKVAEKPVEAKGSLIIKILKILFYIILLTLVLIFLIVLGFLVFLKVQNPDLTFEELVDELKVKVLEKMGIHEMIGEAEEGVAAPTVEAVPTEAPMEMPPEETESVTPPSPEAAPEEEIIEGEVEEEVPEEQAEEGEEPPLAKETGPVPDWMKGATEETAPPAEKPEQEKPVEEPVEEPVEKPVEPTPPVEPEPAPEEPVAETPAKPEVAPEPTPEPEDEISETPPTGEEMEKEPVPDWMKESGEETSAEPAIPPEPAETPAEESPAESIPLEPEPPSEPPSESGEQGPVPDWMKGK